MKTTTTLDLESCLPRVVELVQAAALAVMEVYEAGPAMVAIKADDSPVTAADQRAEALICRELQRHWSGIPIVAEEAVSAGHVPAVGAQAFWLVDPLDGTKEFISRNGEFTVNVALIENGVPVLGVVAAPALNLLWAGTLDQAYSMDASGTRRSIRTRDVPAEGLTVMGSRSHGDSAAMDHLLQGRRVARMEPAGSSLKLCRVAEGSADLYPRLGRTMEWDIAAGHAVLRAAGGEVTSLPLGNLLRYGKPGFENPHFVAHARPWSVAAS